MCLQGLFINIFTYMIVYKIPHEINHLHYITLHMFQPTDPHLASTDSTSLGSITFDKFIYRAHNCDVISFKKLVSSTKCRAELSSGRLAIKMRPSQAFTPTRASCEIGTNFISSKNEDFKLKLRKGWKVQTLVEVGGTKKINF